MNLIQAAFTGLIYLTWMSLSVSAEFNPKDWSHRQTLVGTVEGASAYVEMPLADEVMSRSALPRYQDVRVVREGNQEVPCIHRIYRAEENVQEVLAVPLGRTVSKGEYVLWTLDLGGKGRRVNLMRIQCGQMDFRRRVSVEGSDDGQVWKTVVKEGYIFDLPSPEGHFRMTDVTFPTSDFRYLRLKVYLTGNHDPFVVNEVSLAEVVKTPGRERVWTYSTWEQADIPKEKSVEWVIDRQVSGLPMDGVEVVVGDRNFYRRLTISVSDNRQDWSPFSDGMMYSFQGSGAASSHMQFYGDGIGRYIKIKVWNGDDPPIHLKEVRVKGWVRAVVFQAEPGQAYSLYVGNRKAQIPQYDLAHLAPKVIGKTVEWKGGAVEPNPQYVPPAVPLSERKGLLGGVLALVVLALGYFLWQTFQRLSLK